MKTLSKLIYKVKASVLLTCVFLISFYSNAQPPDCHNFTNGSFELGNTGFITSLNYTGSTVPYPTMIYGNYAINSSANLANSGFDSIPADCGDSAMFVDGSDIPANDIVWQETVTNLCLGATYTFCFEAVDVHWGYANSNRPSLSYDIGTGPNNTGLLNNTWTQYCISFVATSIATTLTIRQTNFVQDGNDFGIDCISFKGPCGCCPRCVCEKAVANLFPFTVDNDGNGHATLHVSNPMPVTKFRITLVNFSSLVNKECLKCDIPDESRFGTIHDAPPLFGTLPEYGPYDLSTPVDYSHEITWCFEQDEIFTAATTIQLDITFPPLYNLSCCKNDVLFCLRLEFWDKDCKQCDRLVCLDRQIPPAPKSPITTPKQEIKTQSLKVIPNPASNSFNVVIDKDNLNGTLQVFDLAGSLIKEYTISSEEYTVNAKSFADGIYVLKYKTSKGSMEQKVVIRK